ncbi:MAG: flagellar hook-basal body complex protein, partial [Roseburia sp.]|nr:flagellar hook-basal body complex protein [Roseburia sp.]
FSTCQNTNNGGKSTVTMSKGATDGTTGAGKKLGNLIGLSVSNNGEIYGIYDNGNRNLLGQIAVAQFANAAGLEKVGESCYRTTLNSGEFDGIGVEISADGSSMTTGELEMSNVDLSSEFTSMITTQRGFQANSRVITTSDTLLEELVNLKR